MAGIDIDDTSPGTRRGDDPPGSLHGASQTAVTRDGHELHYMERPGPPGPTVVFESGLGASRSYWALTQPLVAGTARTVVYDRSGMGRSAPGPRPRNLRRLTDDLCDLLDHLGDGPFVLVGHSLGGPVVRLAAAARADRVVGLVLVDASDEACDAFFAPSLRRMEKVGQGVLRAVSAVGLARFVFRRFVNPLPPEARATSLAEDFTRSALRTRSAEARDFAADLWALRGETVDVESMPCAVISGTLPSEMGARNRAALNEAHAFRAGRFVSGRHVLARRSGHLIPLTEPQVIADEITRLIVDSRTG